MKEESYIIKKGVDGHVSLAEAPSTPSKGRRATRDDTTTVCISATPRSGYEDDDNDGQSAPRTPSSKRKSMNSIHTSSPSKKKTTPKKASKWEEWEDAIIKKAVIIDGEKGANWHAVLQEINNGRDDDENRTMNSLKLHWSQILRGRMASC